ncbi:DinB family protein [Clostridium thermarum]|uniref:DinB family protein n=1 Tax=Clostridium thermarum TaxID=1716543 RepID=UPI001123BCAA|nr:DinB family protein [Clostridium thermarum]
MDSKRALWNSQQNLLKSILTKQDKFDEAIELCLQQHALVHASEMSKIEGMTFEDELWDGLEDFAFRTMPTAKDETIAWSLWHLTRIEDITMNILVADEEQVINSGDWLERMKVTVCDTGNSMSDEEIIELSNRLDMNELRNYRIAVGRKTREIIQRLKPSDVKRKMEPVRLQRILDEGAVLEAEESRWLIDFWGRKNVAGILLMPVTRHHIVHLNEAMRLKGKCRKLMDKK